MSVIIAEKHRKIGELAWWGVRRKETQETRRVRLTQKQNPRRLSGPQEGSAALDGNSLVWSRRSLARGGLCGY